MESYSQKIIKPENLNANNPLFGGEPLRWIDEEVGIYAMTKPNTQKTVTKYISEISFVSSAKQSDIIESGMEFVSIEASSITMNCLVRNHFTQRIVFVRVDDQERSVPHDLNLEDIKTMSTP